MFAPTRLISAPVSNDGKCRYSRSLSLEATFTVSDITTDFQFIFCSFFPFLFPPLFPLTVQFLSPCAVGSECRCLRCSAANSCATHQNTMYVYVRALSHSGCACVFDCPCCGGRGAVLVLFFVLFVFVIISFSCLVCVELVCFMANVQRTDRKRRSAPGAFL